MIARKAGLGLHEPSTTLSVELHCHLDLNHLQKGSTVALLRFAPTSALDTSELVQPHNPMCVAPISPWDQQVCSAAAVDLEDRIFGTV